MIDFSNKHYITVDEQMRIINGFSDAFRQPCDDDICINEKGSYQFRLYPNGEENPSLFDFDGTVPLYKYEDGKITKRTEQEIEADRMAISEIEHEPTEMEQLRADVDYIAIMTGVEL